MLAQCLGWYTSKTTPLCHGYYQPLALLPLANTDEIRILADDISLYAAGRSRLNGRVAVRDSTRLVTAQRAYIHRDAITNKITKIELIGQVRYLEQDRLMLAQRATINPQDKSAQVVDALYRFNNSKKLGAVLPVWGRALGIERFANQDYLLNKASYSTCAPQNPAWHIEAASISVDHANVKAIARNATLRIGNLPVLYAPYLSFPTSNERKSGFLMPAPGYSNVGGFDLALPYYWNIAPNYDAVFNPHLYSARGLMLGSNVRFLTKNSTGIVHGDFLAQDRAFSQFILENQNQYPSIRGTSANRWEFLMREHTSFNDNLAMNINYQQVSDNYYLQDFSTNLGLITENQLLRQGELSYTRDHWAFSALAQSYQTLHPINQSAIASIYSRLPQLKASTAYNDLPMHANFNMLSEFDYFHWPADNFMQPQGARYHLNPVLSFPYLKSWAYIKPALELNENYYTVNYISSVMANDYNRTIPSYSIDSALLFERSVRLMGHSATQSLEPRIYYLYTPFRNQASIPVYDSAYMIFSMDQLFRKNRFSGFDRIGDANQLAYALTSRWLIDASGEEKANFSIGQIKYFSDRNVGLCYQLDGSCSDNPLQLGYLSQLSNSSPIAARALYKLNSLWSVNADYAWDVYTNSTNNGSLNFHYQPAYNNIINFGYTYLSNGNVLQMLNNGTQANPLHQATIATSWPFTEQLSGVGAYSYNLSEHYGMMTFAGLQYDNCCWAVRLMGGRAFKSLLPGSLIPQYNNNVYLQILLKGLGSVASHDPSGIINSYLPEYHNMF